MAYEPLPKTGRERERVSNSPPNQAFQGVFDGTTATVLIRLDWNRESHRTQGCPASFHVGLLRLVFFRLEDALHRRNPSTSSSSVSCPTKETCIRHSFVRSFIRSFFRELVGMGRNLVLVEDVKGFGVVVKGPHQILQHPSVDGSVARRGLGPGSRSTARVAR
jgi:hypothetical protein